MTMGPIEAELRRLPCDVNDRTLGNAIWGQLDVGAFVFLRRTMQPTTLGLAEAEGSISDWCSEAIEAAEALGL